MSDEAHDIAQAVIEMLDKRRSMDDETHREDHAWLRAQRVKEEKRTKFWEALITHLAKWGLIGIAVFITGALWASIKHAVQR